VTNACPPSCAFYLRMKKKGHQEVLLAIDHDEGKRRKKKNERGRGKEEEREPSHRILLTKRSLHYLLDTIRREKEKKEKKRQH